MGQWLGGQWESPVSLNQNEAVLAVLTQELLKPSEIEGRNSESPSGALVNRASVVYQQ
jgi:hypothetical protein